MTFYYTTIVDNENGSNFTQHLQKKLSGLPFILEKFPRYNKACVVFYGSSIFAKEKPVRTPLEMKIVTMHFCRVVIWAQQIESL